MAGERLTKDEVHKRVMDCYRLRFQTNEGCKYVDWLKYCHTHYGDKSELMYGKYWSQANELYEQGWKEKLNKFIDPAVNKIITLMEDENPKVALEATKMVFKYTGNEITKIDAKVEGDIKISFGDPEPESTLLEEDE
jgi:hypothetical protein